MRDPTSQPITPARYGMVGDYTGVRRRHGFWCMLPSYGQDKRLDLAPGKEVHQGQNPNALPLQEPKVARVPGDQGSRMGRKRDLRDR